MRSVCLYLCLAFVASACTTLENSGIPEGYEGETATISDTFAREGMDEAYMFYVKKVDDIPLEHASSETRTAGINGQRPVVFFSKSREVPARTVELTLVVWHQNMRPFGRPATENPIVEETTTFTPKAGQYYVVKGEAKGGMGSVWIENVDGEKVSGIHGSMNDKKTRKQVTDVAYSRDQYLFLTLSGGESGDIVKAKLGEPEEITEEPSSSLTPGVDQVIFHYPDLGDVHFNSYRGSLTISAIHPGRGLDSATIVKFLGVAGAPTQRNIAKHLHDKDVTVSTGTLDEVARFVWDHRDVEGGMDEDAISWFCRVLGEKGHGRYNEFLELLSARASSRKLSGYAEQSVSNHSASEITQFEIKQHSSGDSEG